VVFQRLPIGPGLAYCRDEQEYLDLQRQEVAKVFGLLQDGNTDKDEGQVDSQITDFTEGEGRCPVVPLVFKTSSQVFREIKKDRGLAITPCFLPFAFFHSLSYFSQIAQNRSFFGQIDKRIDKR